MPDGVSCSSIDSGKEDISDSVSDLSKISVFAFGVSGISGISSATLGVSGSSSATLGVSDSSSCALGISGSSSAAFGVSGISGVSSAAFGVSDCVVFSAFVFCVETIFSSAQSPFVVCILLAANSSDTADAKTGNVSTAMMLTASINAQMHVSNFLPFINFSFLVITFSYAFKIISYCLY